METVEVGALLLSMSYKELWKHPGCLDLRAPVFHSSEPN